MKLRLIQIWRASVIAALSMTLVVASGSVSALAEDEDQPAAQAMVQNQFEVHESNFDQWVFGSGRTATQGKQRIETLLTLNIEDVDRTCKLAEAQRKKLLLAGRGDIKRYFDEVEVVRKEFLVVRKDQEKFNQIWQKIQPLQTKLATGIYTDESFFLKTVHSTLTSEQAAAYDKAQFERRKMRYFARIDHFVAMMENNLPMRDQQRQQLIKLLQEETRIPRKVGTYDFYVVQYQLANIPEEKLKPLFDKQQWQSMQQQIAQGRGMEQFLRTNKILPE